MKKISKVIVMFMATAFMFITNIYLVPSEQHALAATSDSSSESSETIYVGTSLKLTVSGAKGKVTWKSSNSKIAKISKKGKVTGVKAGKVTITAKVDNKSYKCVVIVKNQDANAKSILVTAKVKNDISSGVYIVEVIAGDTINESDMFVIESNNHFLEGTGSKDNPYLVSSIEEFNNMIRVSKALFM